MFACRPIPSEKCLGVKQIGVSKVLQKVIGKAVMCLSKKLILESSSDIQICACQKSGNETAIYTMRDFYEQDNNRSCYFSSYSKCFQQHLRGGSVS